MEFHAWYEGGDGSLTGLTILIGMLMRNEGRRGFHRPGRVTNRFSFTSRERTTHYDVVHPWVNFPQVSFVAR